MPDLFSTGAGIVGVIGLAIQITQVVVQFGLDWKDAPYHIKSFLAELQTLNTVLSVTNTNILLNPDFAEAFQGQPSILLSQLGPNAPRTTDTKLMLQLCEKELKDLLAELQKKAKGNRVGWERLKGAFLAKNTRESVENLHRQCQALNNLVSIDTAVLGVTTYKEVKETRKEQQTWHQVRTDKDLLNWLTTADYGSQQSDFLSRRQEGTGQWLLESNEFQNWCDGDQQTLFCPGMPGAGKTIMASIVVDHLCTKYQDDINIGIAYLYCNFRRQYEQKPVDLLVSLLKQLIQGLRSVPESVKTLYERHKDKQTRPSFDEISKELYLTIGGYTNCFIIIDALDECQASDGGLRKFLSELSNLQAKAKANLFVTSRIIPEITKGFVGKSALLEIHASDEDVRRYLDGHMTRLPSFVLRSMDLREKVRNEIVEAVKGMFLLAHLHLDSLIGTKSVKALRTALQKLPTGSDAYDQAYEEAMNRIEGQIPNSRELALQIFSWITCAKRPLTTLELQHALAVEVDESELDEENLPEIEDIVSVCAGLVTIDDESDIIRLVHYTTQQYFERTQTTWFPDAQRDIARTCFTYLSFDTFKAGFCLTDKEFESRLQLNQFYDYAARNWGHHVRAASTDVQDSIPGFLESEAKASACSQAMMISTATYPYSRYSQDVPRQMTGVHLTAWFGLAEITSMLIANGCRSDCRDEVGQTPLSYAAANGHETVVRLLLTRAEVEADSKSKANRTPLSYAAANGQEAVVRLLLTRADVKADSKTRHGNRTPLSYAAANGHEAVVRLLLTRADVNADSKDYRDQTPSFYAARDGHEAVVRLLRKRDNQSS